MSTAVASRTPVANTEGLHDHEVAQGRIFRLPPREELPLNAVRRAHGNGTVNEGMYNHPVVVVSRPEEEPGMVHFHLVSTKILWLEAHAHRFVDNFIPRQDSGGDLRIRQ